MATPSDKAQIARAFPNLANEDFEIVCPPCNRYNCIAYAVGDTSQPWSDEPPDYWPPEVPRSPTITGLQNLFRWLGFRKCNGPRPEPDYLKVALYASKGLWTHAALQTPTGRWRSKLGEGPLIEHQTPNSLNGAEYGRPWIYMRRRRQTN